MACPFVILCDGFRRHGRISSPWPWQRSKRPLPPSAFKADSARCDERKRQKKGEARKKTASFSSSERSQTGSEASDSAEEVMAKRKRGKRGGKHLPGIATSEVCASLLERVTYLNLTEAGESEVLAWCRRSPARRPSDLRAAWPEFLLGCMKGNGSDRRRPGDWFASCG